MNLINLRLALKLFRTFPANVTLQLPRVLKRQFLNMFRTCAIWTANYRPTDGKGAASLAPTTPTTVVQQLNQICSIFDKHSLVKI